MPIESLSGKVEEIQKKLLDVSCTKVHTWCYHIDTFNSMLLIPKFLI